MVLLTKIHVTNLTTPNTSQEPETKRGFQLVLAYTLFMLNRQN